MSNDVTTIRWAEDGSDAAVADHVARVVEAQAAPVIAVPGGRTPVAIFADLAARQLDWAGATVMLCDDRDVPRDNPASNQALLESALGDSGAQVPALAEGMAVPALDLLWLGMGADGHIASLFPQMEMGGGEEATVIRTVPDPLPPEAPYPRLSMSMEALTTAPRETILVIRGDDKRAVLEAAIKGESDLPIASFLSAARGPVTIYWSQG